MTVDVTPASTSPDWRRTRARLANFARRHPDQPPPDELVTDHAEATLAAHIRKVVDAAPPLSAEQRDRLASLLRPIERSEGAA